MLVNPVTSRRKHLVIAASALAHLALIAAFLRSPAPVAMGPDLGAMSVSLFNGQRPVASQRPHPSAITGSGPSSSKPRKTRPRPPPTDIVLQVVDVSLKAPEVAERDPLQDPVALSVAAAASDAFGQSCQIAAWLQAALQSRSPGPGRASTDPAPGAFRIQRPDALGRRVGRGPRRRPPALRRSGRRC